jgi:tetratricopeptide (TPR) repeat protein
MLLGDVLLEQGRLEEAATAYQKMMQLKPGLQAYIRAAQLRWLKGDLDGALQIARLAVRASSPTDPEAAAWVTTKLALYSLQANALPQAGEACEAALQQMPDYAPALLARGACCWPKVERPPRSLWLQQAPTQSVAGIPMGFGRRVARLKAAMAKPSKLKPN